MLNKIWPIFIILSIIFSFLNGKISDVSNSILNSAENTIYLTLSLTGTMCLWNGIMNIAKETSIISSFERILNPVINFLFPKLKNKKKIKKEVSMNIIANILGLGNAATPLGLKAITSMQEENENKETLSDSMMMFIVINTASIQLIPTTVIAIRNSLDSYDSTGIIFPVWIATICAAIAGILMTKILIKFKKKE